MKTSGLCLALGSDGRRHTSLLPVSIPSLCSLSTTAPPPPNQTPTTTSLLFMRPGVYITVPLFYLFFFLAFFSPFITSSFNFELFQDLGSG